MKAITILIPLWLSLNAAGQQKGDNTIIAKGNVSMQKIKEVLFEKGYMINSLDTVFFSTEPKHFNKGDYSVKFNIHKTDSTVILKGLLKVETELTVSGVKVKYDYEPVNYRIRKTHPFTLAFMEMKSIAERLSTDIQISKL